MTDGDMLLYFCSSSALVLIVGLVLCFFWKAKIGRFLGFFVLKPVIVYWISLISWVYLYYRIHTHLNIFYIIHFVLEVCLLLVIYYWSREIYQGFSQLPRLFVGFDLLRWGSALLFSNIVPIDNSGEIAYLILFTTPILAAVFVLIYAINRRQTSQLFQGN